MSKGLTAYNAWTRLYQQILKGHMASDQVREDVQTIEGFLETQFDPMEYITEKP